MRFNEHSEHEGKHAFLSPSAYHWVNYDDQKLRARFESHQSSIHGVQLHKFAALAISLRIYIDPQMGALADYVNHAIDFGLAPEVMLWYSENAFGTADAIALDESPTYPRPVLRIHDYKSGITPTKVTQLQVYAALFCLEYGYDPFELDFDLRIYQRDEIKTYETPSETISFVMEKLIASNAYLERLKEERR